MQAFQRRHGLDADGRVGPATLAALDVPIAARIEQIRVNLERGRWLLHDLAPTFVVVNVAGFRVYYLRDGELVWSSRAVVGKPYRETPIFRSEIDLPGAEPHLDRPARRSSRKDILPAQRRDPGYLATQGAPGDRLARRRRADVVDRLGARDGAQLPLHAAPGPRAGQRARPREVHVPELVLGLSARHAEPQPVRQERARVQLGLHPRRESARARRAAARGSGGLGPRGHRPRGRRRARRAA